MAPVAANSGGRATSQSCPRTACPLAHAVRACTLSARARVRACAHGRVRACACARVRALRATRRRLEARGGQTEAKASPSREPRWGGGPEGRPWSCRLVLRMRRLALICPKLTLQFEWGLGHIPMYMVANGQETAFVDVWDSIVIICLGITALYMPVEATARPWACRCARGSSGACMAT